MSKTVGMELLNPEIVKDWLVTEFGFSRFWGNQNSFFSSNNQKLKKKQNHKKTLEKALLKMSKNDFWC